MGSLKFEAALSRLETLVGSMEKGDLSLEASLKVFEEGVRLSKTCLKLLNDAEKKVAFLMNDQDVPPPPTESSEIIPMENPNEEELPESDVDD